MTEPGNEIVHRAPVDSWIDVMGPVGQLSAHIARTEFVPASMRNKPDAVAAAILTGRELNLSPLTSLRGINIIEGRPSLSAELLGARILSAGHKIEWLESTDKSATVHISRRDGLSEATVQWTMKDAERAGLLKKSNWQKYPRDMLRHRALTEAARMSCPDIALGLDTDWQPETLPVATGQTVTVQVAPRTAQRAPESPPAPEPDREGQDTAEEASEAPTEGQETLPLGDGPIQPDQIVRLHTIVSDMQRIAGNRMTPDQKRAFIVRHAGLNDAEIGSIKQLTAEQAQWAIDSLVQARALMLSENEQ